MFLSSVIFFFDLCIIFFFGLVQLFFPPVPDTGRLAVAKCVFKATIGAHSNTIKRPTNTIKRPTAPAWSRLSRIKRPTNTIKRPTNTIKTPTKCVFKATIGAHSQKSVPHHTECHIIIHSVTSSGAHSQKSGPLAYFLCKGTHKA